MMVKRKSFTKYIAGTERLASAIGNGGLEDIGIVVSEGLIDKRMERDSLLRRVMEPYPLRINRNRLDTLYAMTRPDTTAELTYFFHPDHLGSASWITDLSGQPVQHLQYKPFGGDYIDQQAPNTDYSERFRFTGKERDAETGYDYFGARYYSSSLGIWLSVDPMSDKYPSLSPYVYCADNPVNAFDLDGMDWVDADGNKIEDHSKIKAYIFYDPRENGFAKQSKEMYNQLEAKYGKGSVAMSNATTTEEFTQDWGDMASPNIREVNLNYHGNNQTVMLNSDEGQYITATGDGKTNRSETKAINVQDLPMPLGNIDNAQLNLNTCQSNNRMQYELKGNKQTLMEAFYNSTTYKTVRGTSSGVSYDRKTKQPFPGHSYRRGTWDYMNRPKQSPPKHPRAGLPPK